MTEKSPAGASRNPYVFVVGCPRSGTTLLQRMLDNHPLLAVANDTHFIPRVIENVPTGVDPVLDAALVQRVRDYRRFHRLGLSDDEVDEAAEDCDTYSEFVGRLYTTFARQRGKELGGEKTPDYVRRLPRLHALFPGVRSIHLYRDGRDVALSTLEWAREGKGPSRFDLWAREPVAVCALWWRRFVETGRSDGTRIGEDRHRTVRYETLVAATDSTLSGLADFLDLPNAPEMAAFHVGRTTHRPERSAKGNWLPSTPGLRDWRAAMSTRDLAMFEALAGDLLESLGYARGVDTVPGEVSEAAEECRAWWGSNGPTAQTGSSRDCHGEHKGNRRTIEG